VFYQYLLSTSKQVVIKWGTFVEGIFNQTSYMPYLTVDEQSKFYQGLLFQPCLSYEYSGNILEYNDNLCHITTKDYKTYYVSIGTWSTRSDGVPVSLDDVFFTYNDILSHNIWNIPYLDIHWDVKVSQTTSQNIKVEFPKASVDNTVFFTNYILPRHILLEKKVDYYKNVFSREPIYTNCARIVSQNTDPNSLVFDLSSCEDTYLWYYQLKNTNSFEQLEQSVDLNASIVDAYIYPDQASGYVQTDLMTNKFVTLFFNTKSKKTSVRLRRSLWWLIHNNFYTWDYNKYIKKYDNKLFSTFLSTWANIVSFLDRVDSTEAISKADLVDVWIGQLPSNISISGTDKKLVYFIEGIWTKFAMNFTFDKSYDKIVIHHWNDLWYTPKSYNKKKKTCTYNVWVSLQNLDQGINKYTVYWYQKDEKIKIATIDLYNLKWGISASEVLWDKPAEKIIILYFRDINSIFVANQLQKIFSQYKILDYFEFVGVDTKEELNWKISIWDYDMIINTINMWLKKDLSKIFATDKAQINHSQYVNDRFLTVLQQYLQTKERQADWVLAEVNAIYEKDMPFVMLWTKYEPLYIEKEMLQKFKKSVDNLHEASWRKTLYRELHLVENINIDIDQAGSLKQFLKFLWESIKSKSTKEIKEDAEWKLEENTEDIETLTWVWID